MYFNWREREDPNPATWRVISRSLKFIDADVIPRVHPSPPCVAQRKEHVVKTAKLSAVLHFKQDRAEKNAIMELLCRRLANIKYTCKMDFLNLNNCLCEAAALCGLFGFLSENWHVVKEIVLQTNYLEFIKM